MPDIDDLLNELSNKGRDDPSVSDLAGYLEKVALEDPVKDEPKGSFYTPPTDTKLQEEYRDRCDDIRNRLRRITTAERIAGHSFFHKLTLRNTARITALQVVVQGVYPNGELFQEEPSPLNLAQIEEISLDALEGIWQDHYREEWIEADEWYKKEVSKDDNVRTKVKKKKRKIDDDEPATEHSDVPLAEGGKEEAGTEGGVEERVAFGPDHGGT